MQSLPSSIEAEINILSSILIDPKKIINTIGKIKEDDFYNTANQKIYSAMVRLFSENNPIEPLSIINTIGKDSINDIGGPSYITSLMEAGLNSSNINYNMEILKDKSKRRKLIKALTLTTRAAYDDKNDLDKLINEIQSKIVLPDTNSKIMSSEQLLSKTIMEIEKRYKNGGEIPGMKTGFSSFDRATNGFKKGEFTVIAGRPSTGKTLVALHFADGLAQHGYKVCLFEMEMTEEALGMRRLSYTSLVDSYKIQKGDLNSEEWDKVSMAYSKLAARSNLFIDCSADNNILDIKAKAKLLKQSNGLDAIIIDHLTLLKMSKDTSRRDLEIGDITRQCKLMAKELDINVIILSQLSRAPEQRSDHRPILSDLRESGAIEQDADMVIFIYRDDYYNKDSEDKGTMEWIIAKQRNGRTGTLKFFYLDKFQSIRE